MRKLVIANWKMNPSSETEAVRLARREDFKNVVVAPPFSFLSAVKKVLKKSRLGAQNVFWEKEGAYTGEVSPRQLKSLGVSHVIVGHSERRTMGETDAQVNKKVKAALTAGLKVILCVGEPWNVRRKGLVVAKRFVKNQLQKDIENCKLKIENFVVAYEPVWAIGTGRADKPEDTAEMARFIKKVLRTKILYGGSVKAGNAAKFLSREEIDGALVGGASLRPSEFRKIVESAE